jgi:putative transposase
MLKVEISVKLLTTGGSTMKKSKLSEAQIVAMLNEAEAGIAVSDLCRKYGIANSTYYKLKSRYAGMSVSALKRLKDLEAENFRLKSMYADVSLDHKILKEVVEKKFPHLIDES